jgi:hypothetical protein
MTIMMDRIRVLESTVTTVLVEGKSLFVAPDGDGSHPRMQPGRPAAMPRPRRWENAQAASDGDRASGVTPHRCFKFKLNSLELEYLEIA